MSVEDYSLFHGILSTKLIHIEDERIKRPKRRRQPQKPGLTARGDKRHFVQHDYHDFSQEREDINPAEKNTRNKNGVISFPRKLHEMLEKAEVNGISHIVSWLAHGRAFTVHHPKVFVSHVLTKYFRQTKMTSFQRQLNLYGFARLTRGLDQGGYYHEFFLRGKPFLISRMVRTKIKGTRFKATSSPDQEPNFYSMQPVFSDSSALEGQMLEDIIQNQITNPKDHEMNSNVCFSYDTLRSTEHNKGSHQENFDTPREFVSILNDPLRNHGSQDNFIPTHIGSNMSNLTTSFDPVSISKHFMMNQETVEPLLISNENLMNQVLSDQQNISPAEEYGKNENQETNIRNCSDELSNFVQKWHHDHNVTCDESHIEGNLIESYFTEEETENAKRDDHALKKLFDHMLTTI